jgi:hypothetical protein
MSRYAQDCWISCVSTGAGKSREPGYSQQARAALMASISAINPSGTRAQMLLATQA